jgi:hypothetical protein
MNIAPTSAQSPQQQMRNPNIRLEYREPRYNKIYQWIKNRKVLEQFDALLSPLKLKHRLTLTVDDTNLHCRASSEHPNSFYNPKTYTVHICYNFLDMVINDASSVDEPDPKKFSVNTTGLIPGFSRGEVIIGASAGLILHELGHAIFHNLEIPILGREEDAADQIAGFMMLQFGPEVALPTIRGTFNVWHHLNALGFSKDAQADVHGLSLQRAQNYLCLAYGSPHSASFKTLAEAYLTKKRRDNCKSEYETTARAFNKTILPHVIDQAQLKNVQQMQIFKPEDFK